MWTARSLLASSIKGRLSISDNTFHSVPSLFEISELCIFGFSWSIFLRCPRDQTIKAFIGLFTLSCSFFAANAAAVEAAAAAAVAGGEDELVVDGVCDEVGLEELFTVVDDD